MAKLSHTGALFVSMLCLGTLTVTNAKAAPAQPIQSRTSSSVIAEQNVAPDASITDVYWAYRHGRRYWVQPRRRYRRY